MILPDDDRSLRARLLRAKWAFERWLMLPFERKFTLMICAFRGCVWHEAKWERQELRDPTALKGYPVVAAHRTCSRCLRNTLTYHAEEDKFVG